MIKKNNSENMENDQSKVKGDMNIKHLYAAVESLYRDYRSKVKGDMNMQYLYDAVDSVYRNLTIWGCRPLEIMTSALLLFTKGYFVGGDYLSMTKDCPDGENPVVQSALKLFRDSISIAQKKGYKGPFVMFFSRFIDYLFEKDLSCEKYADLYDYIVSTYGADSGRLLMPKEFIGLANLFFSDGANTTIFNPFAGLCQFADCFNKGIKFEANELDRTTYTLGLFRHELKVNKCDLSLKNCLEWTDKKHDAIVTFPPLGYLIDRKHRADVYILDKFENDVNSADRLFIITTKAILINEYGLLSKLRKQIIDSNHLDTVVNLPSQLLKYSGVELVALFLDKKRSLENPICFIDASEMYDIKSKKERVLKLSKVKEALLNKSENTLYITNEQIRSNNYRFSYIELKREQEVSLTPGYTSATLQELIERVGTRVKMVPEEGKLFLPRNLTNNPFENNYRAVDLLSAKDYETRTQRTNLKNGMPFYRVSGPVLLVSRLGTIRTAVYNDNEPLYINNSVFAFKLVSDKISLDYLRYQLSKLENYFLKVTSIVSVSLTDIYNTIITFPETISEQERILHEVKLADISRKLSEDNLKLLLETRDSEYKQEVENRQHTMNRFLQNMRSFKNNFLDILDEGYIKPEFEEEVKVLVNNFAKSFDTLSEMVDALNKEEIYGESKRINIDNFTKEKGDYDRYEYRKNNELYMLKRSFDEESLSACGIIQNEFGSHSNLFVEMDPDKLNEVYDNIVANAIRHGFTDKTRKDYFLEVRIGADVNKQMLQIEFINNGNPLPSGLDRKIYGQRGVKVGDTGNTGIGGSTIKRVMEHYNGDYDIFSDGGNTVVKLLIPFANE